MWPHLRAIFIAFHVIAIGLMAFPAPGGGMNRTAWKQDTVQAEFQAWTERINGLGIDITQAAFEDQLWDIATGFMGARDTVLDPFMLYYRELGAWQSWRMFVAPHRYPARLEIEVQRGTPAWHKVYVMRSEEHNWLKPQFDHDRFRSAIFRYAWPRYKGTYRQFVDWLAVRARTDHPDATRLRVRFYRFKTLPAADIRAGKSPQGKYIFPAERKLR